MGIAKVIVDSSVIVAILGNEPEAPSFEEAIAGASPRRLSAASYVEAEVVVDRRYDPIFSRKLDDLLRDAQITMEPVSIQQARLAREAYRDFGKGRHRAGLNFGDCFAYEVAKEYACRLLYVGDDFAQTDIESVL